MTYQLTWDRQELEYLLNGKVVPIEIPKGAADAVMQEAKARIGVIATRIQAGDITLAEGWAEAKQATKIMTAAETALARGGWDQMRPSDWERASERLLEVWEGREGTYYTNGLRTVFEAASQGFYGPDLRQRGFASDVASYVGDGHAIYENTRAENHKESGFKFGTRIAANVDHCSVCVEEDGVKRPIDEVVAIGDSPCRGNCRCVVVFDRE